MDEAAGKVVCRTCGLVAEDKFLSELRDRDLKNDDGTTKTLQRTEVDDASGNTLIKVSLLNLITLLSRKTLLTPRTLLNLTNPILTY
jgi:transcription initiation factor TFIIIB Brf1 subunit/transcription initiation factor TFIIB